MGVYGYMGMGVQGGVVHVGWGGVWRGVFTLTCARTSTSANLHCVVVLLPSTPINTHHQFTQMVCVGDALSPSVAEQGPYSGMIVDLFAQGRLLPELCEGATWQQLRGMLVPGGRLMVNIGGVGLPGCDMGERALAALAAAFDGVCLCLWGCESVCNVGVCVCVCVCTCDGV